MFYNTTLELEEIIDQCRALINAVISLFSCAGNNINGKVSVKATDSLYFIQYI